MVSERREITDLSAYIEAVERRARAMRAREVAYQAKLFGETIASVMAAFARRFDRFLFPPHVSVR